MTDKKLSAEDLAVSVTGSERVRITQGGVTKATTLSAIADLATAGSGGSNLVDLKLDFGAAIDGATDDLTPVNNALASQHTQVFVQEGDAKVSAVPTNVYGPEVGPGRILLPFTQGGKDGTRQLNLTGDRYATVFGTEYLSAIRALLSSYPSTPPTADFTGDSTTAGDAIVNPSYKIHSMVQQALRDKGFELDARNRGVSGINTDQWVSTYLAGDIAAGGNMLVIRLGINDPAFNKTGDGAANTADSYDAQRAHRRDAGDFATSLRAGLATIRGTSGKGVANLSIILMSPNCTSDSPNGRDEKWYEQINRVIRKAARDYRCCFIDTYRAFQDTRWTAGVIMDDPYSDGRAIHPKDAMNVWIASLIADAIAPTAMSLMQRGSGFGIAGLTDAPYTYPIGFSTRRAQWTVGGVYVDGHVETVRGADGVCRQSLYPYSSLMRISTRTGMVGVGWRAWESLPTVVDPSLHHGWSLQTVADNHMRMQLSGGVVTLSGRLTGGSTTGSDDIFALPAEYTPQFDCFRPVLCGSNLQTPAIIAISSSGFVFPVNIGSNALLDIGCSYPVAI